MYYYSLQSFLFSAVAQGILVFLLGLGLYMIAQSYINQNERLRMRSYTLAQMLQTAELQTGTAYYSSIAADATEFEYNRPFFSALQNRIKYPQPPILPVAQQEPEHVEDDPDM